MAYIGASLSRRRVRTAGAAILAAALVAVVVQQSWAGTPLSLGSIGSFLVTGVALGSIYGVAAQGLVVTYTTSGIFNFAQGAIGMFMAFVYWQLKVGVGLPTFVAVILTVGVFAPIMGILLERLLMRRLVDAPLVAQLVVTIGLMLALMGLAASIWNPNNPQVIPQFFGTGGFTIADTFVPWFRVVTVLSCIALGIGLRFLLYHTRLGIVMRAVVDNRDLTSLNGARPARATMAAWALGSSMAALAGLFLAEEVASLDSQTLTLFIVDAFAAAIIARLRSLPMAYVGGLVIGFSIAFQETFLAWNGRWTAAPSAIPAAILFIALLFVRQGRIEGRAKPRKVFERVPSFRTALVGFIFLIVVVIICSAAFDQINVRQVLLGMLTAFVMLSLVPLTGYANQISLAQITLVGCGAFAFAEWGHGGNVLDLLLSVVLAVVVGVVMALPAIRLQGLYLALATMAFARMAEFLLFDQPDVFGNANLQVPLLSLFGLHVDQPFSFLGLHFPENAGYLIFVTVLFCFIGGMVLRMRRGPFGRRLIAMRDSQAATAMLGANVTLTKLGVFTYSSAIAGLAGGLFAMYYGSIGTSLFQMTAGLPYLLLLVVGGVTTVGGAVFGGFSLVAFSWLTAAWPTSTFLQWLQRIGPGLAGVGIGQNPEGGWPVLVATYGRVLDRVRPRPSDPASLPAAAAPPPPPRADSFRDLQGLPARKNPDAPLLELQSINVRFGGLQAIRDVSITLAEGTITGLIGPNGAGKTTLFNVATGLQEPTNGRIFVEGSDVTGKRPHELARLGLARTFQRLEVFGTLSVRDNIRVAAEIRRVWSRDRSVSPDRIAEAIMERVGLQSVADVPADALPTGTARLLEVARALASRPRLLLLDEPSSGLSSAETASFASLLRELVEYGITILLVEHDMGFIMDLCDSIVVLDAGEIIAKGSPAEVQLNPKVLEAYLGSSSAAESEIPLRASAQVSDRPAGPVATDTDTETPALDLRGISAGYGGIDVLYDVSLTVKRGQVCAILGPNGAGKSTTLKVASGQIQPTSGTVSILGRPIAKVPTDQLVRSGLRVVPEGRGVFPNLTVVENLKIASYAGVAHGEILESAFSRFPQLHSRRGHMAGTLSGGEQQMLAIARALAVKPSILMLDELSMGLAPRIVEELYEVVEQIAAEGLSIVIVEQFAHEVLRVADVAAVMVNGKITNYGTPAQISEILGSAYLGGQVEEIEADPSLS